MALRQMHTDEVIYFVSFDPFSMVTIEMQNYAASLGMKNLECENIYELSRESGDKLLSLSECLKYIADLHAAQKVHVLVDEYDDEKMNVDESLATRKVLDEFYKDSTVVISVQSVEKKRESKHGRWYWFGNKVSSPVACWNDMPFKVFRLKHTMRNTQEINNLIEVFQNGLKEISSFVYMPVTKAQSANKGQNNKKLLQRYILPKDEKKGAKSNLKKSTSTDNLPQSCLVAVNQEISNKVQNIHIPESIGSLARYQESNIDTSVVLKTTVNFVSSSCGHNVSGRQPTLLRLHEPHLIDTNVIKRYIEDHCFEDGKRKAFFICNYQHLMLAFVEVFKIMNSFNTVKCFNRIINKQPLSLEDQQQIYSELLSDNTKELIVLSDNHGCRGLEYEKV